MEDLQDQLVAWLAKSENAPLWFAKAVLTDDKKWEYVEAGKVKTAMADTVSRKLRLAEESKRIARRDSGKSCEYRFLPPEHRERYIPWSLREDKNILFRLDGQTSAPEPKKRTLSQNAAMHKLFALLSDDLNEKGLDMKVVLKPSYQIWWTPQSVKEHLWKPLQEVMYQKKSTTELETKEVDRVFEQLAKILGEHHGIEMSFPSIETEALNHLED